MSETVIYAPKAATKIDKAADLIHRASILLDSCGDRYVIAEIEKIEGTQFICAEMVDSLRKLADRLDT